MPKAPALFRFRKLVDDISRLYLEARRVQIQFAWATGRRIIEEEQNGAMRAAYGLELIPRLSKVLTEKYGPGFSESSLRKMRHFFLLHPKQSVPTELDWTDYVELLPIKDEKIRRRLEQRIIKDDLNSLQVRQLVKKARRVALKSPVDLPPLKRPADLKLYTFAKSLLKVGSRHAVTLQKAGLVLIDCGFFVSWPVKREDLKNLTITEELSYTYAATLDRVIDGDTLLVLIEVGFGIIVRDRLRLRGINTPELGTPEGDRAKKFVEKILPSGSTILLKSHKCKTDTYGRFVADVFYKEKVADAQTLLKDSVYLNQQLLDEGLAQRMAE